MMYGRGFGFGGGFGHPFFGGLMGFFGLLLTVAFIVALVRLARHASHAHSAYATGCCGHHTVAASTPAVGSDADEAVAIARRRLASGEISAEQYGEIIEHLSR